MILERLKAARRVSVPIVGIATADQAVTVDACRAGLNGAAPLVRWDIVRGLAGLNDLGAEWCARVVDGGDPAMVSGNPTEALRMAETLPDSGALFMMNAHRIIEETTVVQAILNLRDAFKGNGRTLVLLAPDLRLPAELAGDVLLLDEPLPTRDEIGAILSELAAGAEVIPDGAQLERAADALAGLSAFAVEQAGALSLSRAGYDVAACWERKRRQVEQTRGLSIDRDGITFADLGGLENAKRFGLALMNGRRRVRAVLRLDEIEKMLAGAAGDTSGTSQDALGVILRSMEDEGWQGAILFGPPGSGKTAYSRALGASAGVPTMSADLGAAKGSLVGQSEERIRSIMRTCKAVAGDALVVVATANKLEVLPPELRRRFTLGIWMFDLPTAEERAGIWTMNVAKYETALGAIPAGPLPADEGWTGAEIRNVCQLAASLNVPLVEASKFIVPVSVSDPEGIERSRKLAAGRFLSASYPGPYRMPEAAPKGTGPARRVSLTMPEMPGRAQ